MVFEEVLDIYIYTHSHAHTVTHVLLPPLPTLMQCAALTNSWTKIDIVHVINTNVFLFVFALIFICVDVTRGEM